MTGRSAATFRGGCDGDACLSTCELASCGDGFVWAGEEMCDDGDLENGDGCENSCVTTPGLTVWQDTWTDTRILNLAAHLNDSIYGAGAYNSIGYPYDSSAACGVWTTLGAGPSGCGPGGYDWNGVATNIPTGGYWLVGSGYEAMANTTVGWARYYSGLNMAAWTYKPNP